MASQTSAFNKMAHFRRTGEFSDLEIRCKGESFRVHRTTICPHSEYFLKLCRSDFKEAKEGVIELQDDDPHHLGLLLDYCYTGGYDDEGSSNSGGENDDSVLSSSPVIDPLSGVPLDAPEAPDISISIEQMNLNDARDFQSPAQLEPEDRSEDAIPPKEEEKPTDIIMAQLNNVAVYALAEKYTMMGLKALAVQKFCARGAGEWLDGVGEITRMVFTTTPQSDRGLRKPVIQTCADFWNVIEADSNFEALRQILQELPEAHIEILSGLVRAREETIANDKEFLKISSETIEVANDKIADLETTIKELECKNRELKAKVERSNTEAQEEASKGADRWDFLIKRINGTIGDHCPNVNCECVMRLSVDRSKTNYHTGHILLRCSRCRARMK